jgi:hypothetical protein
MKQFVLDNCVSSFCWTHKTVQDLIFTNLLFALVFSFVLLFSHGGWSSQSDVSISPESSHQHSEVSTGTQGTHVSIPQNNSFPVLSISQVSLPAWIGCLSSEI